MVTVVYRGRSLLARGHVVAAIPARTTNGKTGPLVGVHIVPLRGRCTPRPSCCPAECPFQATGCYVQWRFTDQVRKATRGQPVWPDVSSLASGQIVRLGQSGDPAALPVRVLRALLKGSEGHVAYTHAWRRPRFAPPLPHREIMMASVESPADARLAWSMGWRTFRVRPRGAPILPGEIQCPSARGVHCVDCRLCNGSSSAPSITIEAHGGVVAARFADRIAQA